MNFQISSEYAKLKDWVTIHYNLPINSLQLHREMIGHVYFARTNNHKFVIKLYRAFHRAQAIQSLEIIQYLRLNEYPVVKPILTQNKELFSDIIIENEPRILAVFEYIEGKVPELSNEIQKIGKQVRQLHDLMEKYPRSLITRGENFYIDRFIDLMRQKNYSADKIDWFEQFGRFLWETIEQLPTGFCHGDLHTGNMFKTEAGKFMLFDFDIASKVHPVIDFATICDATNFNALEKNAFENTQKRVDAFLLGYGKSLSPLELRGLFYFIAVRHFELIATIAEARGHNKISMEFLDQQYKWLKKWRVLCMQKFHDT